MEPMVLKESGIPVTFYEVPAVAGGVLFQEVEFAPAGPVEDNRVWIHLVAEEGADPKLLSDIDLFAATPPIEGFDSVTVRSRKGMVLRPGAKLTATLRTPSVSGWLIRNLVVRTPNAATRTE